MNAHNGVPSTVYPFMHIALLFVVRSENFNLNMMLPLHARCCVAIHECDIKPRANRVSDFVKATDLAWPNGTVVNKSGRKER